jgi:hypothetical protein
MGLAYIVRVDKVQCVNNTLGPNYVIMHLSKTNEPKLISIQKQKCGTQLISLTFSISLSAALQLDALSMTTLMTFPSPISSIAFNRNLAITSPVFSTLEKSSAYKKHEPRILDAITLIRGLFSGSVHPSDTTKTPCVNLFHGLENSYGQT